MPDGSNSETIDFIQVADPVLFNEAGRVLCEVSPLSVTTLVFTTFILIISLVILDEVSA